MDFKRRLKRALETSEMTCESFLSLFDHFGVSECVFKVIPLPFSTSWSLVKEILCVCNMFVYVCMILCSCVCSGLV